MMLDLLERMWYNKHHKANRENTYLHFVNICKESGVPGVVEDYGIKSE